MLTRILSSLQHSPPSHGETLTIANGGFSIARGGHVANADRQDPEHQVDDLNGPVKITNQKR